MALSIGDLVVHPAFGLGHIVDIEEKQFSAQEPCLYYKVTQPHDTMWLLVEAQEASGLRLVTAGRDLDQYRTVLKSRPAPLATDSQQRQRELFGRLKEGSFQGVCEVMRDLTAWGWQQPLGQAETTLLHKTQDSLSQEWAKAAGVSVAEATEEIDALLRAARPVSGE